MKDNKENKKVRVLMLGSGFAAKGHTEAFRYCGAEVAGIVSRNKTVVEEVANELDIPYTSDNWREAILALQPDVLSVATPGGAHFEPVMYAIEQGCHIFCDKPLAATAEEAKKMAEAAEKQGVKTAYAASFRYQPCVYLARELIEQDKIGSVWEAECISHFNLNPLIPFGWSHRKELGGGRLNNNFTHKLAIVLHALDGALLSVKGEVRNDMPKAPVVDGVHDFRFRENFAPSPEEAEKYEWKECNVEWSYSVLARVASGFKNSAKTTGVSVEPASVLFKHGGLHPRFNEDYIAFYGSKASIYISGFYAQGPLYLFDKADGWREVPIPEHIHAMLPDIKNDGQRNWTQLAKEFLNDVEGKGCAGYQTFQDGRLFQEVIEAIRNDKTWIPMREC